MDENTAEYEYQFTMDDGESFGISVQHQARNKRWYAKVWNDQGEIIYESYDWNEHYNAAGDAVVQIILRKDQPYVR